MLVTLRSPVNGVEWPAIQKRSGRSGVTEPMIRLELICGPHPLLASPPAAGTTAIRTANALTPVELASGFATLVLTPLRRGATGRTTPRTSPISNFKFSMPSFQLQAAIENWELKI